ncbi:MAG: glycosyltransferase [Pseudomonadota bacterium]
MISFSIVINTLNRAALLQATLESLCRLRYAGRFEVIVVNGPSTDDSAQVIASWLPCIRAGLCPVANLSVSRNIGICMARGDVIAFIDDDAIPEPEWLTDLAEAYMDPEVGGAGGRVRDASGYTYQYEYATATRLADTDCAATQGAPQLCFPGSYTFPYLQGTNASFRRSALLEIGGFDEEFEYFLDETDVCCRLVDAGFLLRQLPNAYVHHKTAPNSVRDHAHLARSIFPVLKNTIYFSLKHGLPYFPLEHIRAVNTAKAQSHRRHVEFLIDSGKFDSAERERFEREHARAWEIGMRRGLEGQRHRITPAQRDAWHGDFQPFEPVRHAAALTLVLVSRDFPPHHSGGIATFIQALAEALAEAGHLVHVITENRDGNRVELANGVWLHHIVTQPHAQPAAAIARAIPQHIWDWSASALAETRRIATQRPIDAVEAPVWDCEGAAFLLADQWPLVTSLQTTLHFWLDTHAELRRDAAWMATFGTPMLALEKELMRQAHAVRAISAAIRHDIERAYDFRFDAARLRIAPLGMPDVPDMPPAPARGDDGNAGLTVLFVGRLEARKGIDILLAAIPAVLARHPGVRFRIIGDDTLPKPGEQFSYKEEFHRLGHLQRCHGRVVFEGRVDDATLGAAYRACDLFVAPSRFESFGLVFLEAMREGKPVIGCDAGGMPEVVAHGVNGLLVAPGDALALEQAILQLLASATLRADMGSAGRARFQQQFTARQMALASQGLFETARQQFAETRP